jgi:transcriptional regulator with XRE-family HTH domain
MEVQDEVSSMSRFNHQVGERLRDARRGRGWSLFDVESESDGEFKASVLGAYERGERSVSAGRLWRLANIYGVHVATLLPGAGRTDGEEDDHVMVDIDAAGSLTDAQGELIDRYLAAIQTMRRDTAGPTLAVRRSDLRVLNALVAADATAALERLAEREA